MGKKGRKEGESGNRARETRGKTGACKEEMRGRARHKDDGGGAGLMQERLERRVVKVERVIKKGRKWEECEEEEGKNYQNSGQ